MSEHNLHGPANNATSTVLSEETTEKGCFKFLRKKEEKAKEDCVMTNDSEEKKHTVMDKLQRTHTHSSSSSEEEAGKRKKKKKKKGVKEENDDEKIMCGDGGEETKGKDTGIPNEKCNEEAKKGFLEKIKEKLPGQQKKNIEEETPPGREHSPGSNTKEKKGLIDKIKEKLPGHHKSNENESKED